MTNTKWLRRALLGGAALSVMATGAQADELTALKAQLEALQSRVSQLESQPAPQLPAGTKLLSVRRGQGTYGMIAPQHASDRLQAEQGYTIAVTPTADMPAPVSEVTVSGEIRALAVYRDLSVDNGSIDLNADDVTAYPEEHDGWDSSDFDVATRARLRIDGKTETAVGEVGGTIRLEGNRNPPGGVDTNFTDDEDSLSLSIGWGYWQMTPNWQLGAGYWDSAAAIQAGWDWNGETALTGLNLANGAGPTNHSVSQVRLTYSNGPLTAAISVEDNNHRGDFRFWADNDEDQAVVPAVAGFITYDAGSFLVTASAIWEADDTEDTNAASPAGPSSLQYHFVDTKDNWMVGVGAILKLSDMFRLEGAANVGNGYTPGIYGSEVINCGLGGPPTGGVSGGRFGPDCENDMGYWGASGLAVVTFTEGMRLELGAAYSNLNHEEDELGDTGDSVDHQWSVAASLFYDPVDQLTLGVGVGFNRQTTNDDDDDDADADVVHAGFGAWFRF